jgi:hypothetical protein
MAYKLIDAAHTRRRKVNAPELVALVRAGAVFHKGKLLERRTHNAHRTAGINRNGGRLKYPSTVLTIPQVLFRPHVRDTACARLSVLRSLEETS